MIVTLLQHIKQLNTNSKLIGSVILSVFVISLLVLQTISIKELNYAISQEESALNIDIQRLTRIQNIKKTYGKSVEKLYTLQASIPSSPSEESILTSLQESSDAASIDVSKITFGKSTAGDGLSQLSFSVTFTGNYYSFINLLDRIKVGNRIVKFDSFTITKDKIKNNIKAEIQAVSFYSSESKPVLPAK